MRTTIQSGFMLVLLAMLLMASVSAADATRPNVIFVLTDDLGYSDIGCYGATKVETPHLDRLMHGQPWQRKVDQPFFYYNCENLQAVRLGGWKLHLPRTAEQLPFWDKNKAFANLARPVLYNLRNDRAETKDVAADNPAVVRQMLSVSESSRKDLGEFMHRGEAQRPTGSVFPDGPVISHEKDWGTVDLDTAEAIAREWRKRHPNQKQTKTRRKKRK